MTPTCEVCGTELVCPKCNPPKKRKLNAQAQAVKTCLDAYVAGRAAIGLPYPGVPPVGRVLQWLGQQPIRDGAVKLFVDAVALAVEAHKLDKQFHAFPATVPKFVDAIPKLNGKWMDDARRNARGNAPSAYIPKELRNQENLDL